MKPTIQSFIIILLALLMASLTSCKQEDLRTEFEEDPGKLSLPGGAVTEVDVVSYTDSSVLVNLELFIFDRFGIPQLQMDSTNFQLDLNNDYQWSLTGLQLNNKNENNPYEALMLIDQSGSMLDNDPKELRLDAAKIFLSKLGENDLATAAAFTTNYLFDGHNLFGKFEGPDKVDKYIRDINKLYGEAGGNTPLYKTTYEMIEYTADNTTGPNKAVIVFTDGEDTEGGRSLNEVAQYANNNGVKLYTVGLSRAVDINVLATMAFETDGAFMWAADAAQLIAIFGTLGNLLEGSADTYLSSWSIITGPGSFSSGLRYELDMVITLEDGDSFIIPFSFRIP